MAGNGMGLDVKGAMNKVKSSKAKAKGGSKRSKGAAAVDNIVASMKASGAAGGSGAAKRKAPAAASKAAAEQRARTVPLGQKQKLVYDIVKERRSPLTFEQLKEALKFPVDGDLLSHLQKHKSLLVDTVGRTVQYKPRFAIATKAEILTLVKRHPLGVSCADIADAYPEARAQLSELVEDDLVLECFASERGDSVAFPNEQMLPKGHPDESMRDLVFDISLPRNEADLDAALKVAGITKAKRSTPRMKMAVIQDSRAVKKKKERKIRKLTNTHMQQLFENGGEHSTID